MKVPRIVGVDYGKRRVGISIADPLLLFTQPVGTFPPQEALLKLKEIHRVDGIKTIVIGWPLQQDGSEGKATQLVEQFIGRLRASLENIQVVRWDERFTSIDAREQIRSGPDPALGKRGRGRIDTAAAGIILEEYLEQIREAPFS